jgi:hypothetical protein
LISDVQTYLIADTFLPSSDGEDLAIPIANTLLMKVLTVAALLEVEEVVATLLPKMKEHFGFKRQSSSRLTVEPNNVLNTAEFGGLQFWFSGALRVTVKTSSKQLQNCRAAHIESGRHSPWLLKLLCLSSRVDQSLVWKGGAQ